MEYTEFGHTRKDSNISDLEVDISDTEHCVLCFNFLKFVALGKCGHKNVCLICALRLRFILKDIRCPICKAELKEILLCEDKSITYETF